MAVQTGVGADELSEVLNAAARLALTFRHDLPHGTRRPAAGYAAMREVFDSPLPEAPSESGRGVIEDLAARAAPGLPACAGPRFFGWVIGHKPPSSRR
jgi:hypothetical protein